MHELIEFHSAVFVAGGDDRIANSIRYSFCIPRTLSRTSSGFFSFSNAMKTRSLIVSLRGRPQLGAKPF
jgi:hypothetical protein